MEAKETLVEWSRVDKNGWTRNYTVEITTHDKTAVTLYIDDDYDYGGDVIFFDALELDRTIYLLKLAREEVFG